ncbi:MAG: thioredoxin domain-containing protein [Proteobacteria bacterium]|nr:thioredoxin domain-containing protein [Pseudomonadota bacterium]
MTRTNTIGFAIIAFASSIFVTAALLACSAGEGLRFITAKELESRLDVTELTPLEIKRLEKVINNEVSPCGDDVTLAESMFNTKHCPLASLAGRFVVGKLMDDYNAEEISTAYIARYAAIKGLEIPVNGSPQTEAKKPIVTLVVFTDFECPFCARAASQIHDLLRRYPDDIALVHKNFPLEAHKEAKAAARAAYAADKQDKFWGMHDTIFSAIGSVINLKRFEIMAEGLGLDMDQFKEDFGSAAATAAIAADKKLGEQLGVTGTPTIFINGRLIESGVSGIEERIQEEFLRNGGPQFHKIKSSKPTNP